jgi:hypothetical protein
VTKFTLVAVASLACLTTLATSASAAPPGFCADYSRGAVRQFELARAIPGCLGGGSARWNPDFQVHYGWCLNVAPGAAFSERAIRSRGIADCRRRAGY